MSKYDERKNEIYQMNEGRLSVEAENKGEKII
jgi:hypothetical protein